jgi:hypothetical protein
MFVPESNDPLENSVIRPMKQTLPITGYYFPVCFKNYKSVFIAFKG